VLDISESKIKQLHIWTHDNLISDLYALDENTECTVFCAEEKHICDDFSPHKLKNSKNISYVLGGTGIEREHYQAYTQNSRTEFWYNFFLYHACPQIDTSALSRPANACLFISLNNRAHFHRCCLIDTLAKYKLLKNNIITWHNQEPRGYNWQHWRPTHKKLEDGFLIDKSQDCLPFEYDLALFNLISESDDRDVFVTEKTWHAILAGKPFLVQGAPKFHRFLQTAGYKLFDDIIDYSFDSELDMYKRTEMLVQELKKLEKQDYTKIWKKIKPVCDHNQMLARCHIRDQIGVPTLAYEFKYYNKLIQDAICKLDTSE